MVRLFVLLQAVGTPPSDFDLRNVRPSLDANAIVVTARRSSQRIEREPVSKEPPLGRAEVPLFGKVKGNVHLDSETLAGGAVSQRVMVGVKLPF